jgi:HSP20 family protein
MRLTRWAEAPLWGGLQQLHDEVNRLFNRWGGVSPTASSYPPVNVWEEDEGVVVEAELPGLQLSDLEIFVTGGNQLTLKGERKAPKSGQGTWHRQERGFGRFVRVLTLPFPVDADKVEARLENGVLLVKLPKHESARPRKIAVKGE